MGSVASSEAVIQNLISDGFKSLNRAAGVPRHSSGQTFLASIDDQVFRHWRSGKLQMLDRIYCPKYPTRQRSECSSVW